MQGDYSSLYNSEDKNAKVIFLYLRYDLMKSPWTRGVPDEILLTFVENIIKYVLISGLGRGVNEFCVLLCDVLCSIVIFCVLLWFYVFYCDVLCSIMVFCVLLCDAVYCIVMFCVLFWCSVFYCDVLCSTAMFCVLLSDVLCSIVMFCVLLWCSMFYCDVLCSIVMFCVLLRCPVFYCDVLCSIVMFCLLSWCSVFYCDVLYSIVMFCFLLWCSVFYYDVSSIHWLLLPTFLGGPSFPSLRVRQFKKTGLLDVGNYQSTLHNIPEEQRYHLLYTFSQTSPCKAGDLLWMYAFRLPAGSPGLLS